jgi:hypothetical protein
MAGDSRCIGGANYEISEMTSIVSRSIDQGSVFIIEYTKLMYVTIVISTNAKSWMIGALKAIFDLYDG